MQNSLIIDPSRPTFFPLPSDNKLDSRAYLETTFFRGRLLEKKKLRAVVWIGKHICVD